MIGDVCEGEGDVWMAMPSDPSVIVRTPIKDGETAKEAAVRLATALATLAVNALMSTVGNVTPLPARNR